MTRLALLLVAALLAACSPQEAEAPPGPVAMTKDALGHYCQMALLEHPGPKAQVHLDGTAAPLFFSQVRDAIAYQRAPEQSHPILAVYVSDMGKAPSWEAPGAENWIAAGTAFYVAGASTPGGMGAPEFVPFSTETAAAAFADRHGGKVVQLNEIADDDVLAPVEFGTDAEGNFVPPEGHATH